MSPACRRLLAFVLFAFTLPLSTAVAGDWPEGLSAKPRFSNLEGAVVVNWTVTNTGKTPFAPGTVRLHYACGNGETEAVNHFYPSTLLPGASESDGDHFLCLGKGGVVSFSVEDISEGSSTAHRLIYLMPCDRAAITQMHLTWNAKGFYDFKTDDGTSGIVARDVLDDGTLMKTACREFGPPAGELRQRVEDWFHKQIFSRPGDRKMGYTGTRS